MSMVVVLAAGPAAAGPFASPASEGDPPLVTPAQTLQAAVWCDPSVKPGANRETVLLIHGTGGTPRDYWSWNWMRALPSEGLGVCTVALPRRALVNMTVSAEYVVYAARYAYQRSGRKITMVGHSQGGTLAVWATKFWRDVANHTEDVVSLSGDFGGTAVGNVDCALRLCPDVAWQAAIGSHTMRAVRSAPLPKGVSYTSVFSYTDEVVTPNPAASTLPGATNIAVQSICPLRVSDHVTMVFDSISWALTVDAIRHSGPAVPDRLDRPGRLCGNPFMPHIDWRGTLPGTLKVILAFAGGLAGGQPLRSAEPALPAYAALYGG